MRDWVHFTYKAFRSFQENVVNDWSLYVVLGKVKIAQIMSILFETYLPNVQPWKKMALIIIDKFVFLDDWITIVSNDIERTFMQASLPDAFVEAFENLIISKWIPEIFLIEAHFDTWPL